MSRKFGLTMGVGVAVLAGVLAAPQVTMGDDTKAAATSGVDAKDAFKRLKTLAGTWKAQVTMEPNDEHATDKGEDHKKEDIDIFKVTGAGSALIETQHPGSNHEMVSVYHLDGDDLRMTHYCAAQNQPRMKLDRAKSTPDKLIFVFDGGTNLDPQKDMHIHGVTISFHEDGKVTSNWQAYVGDKKGMTASFVMSRQSESNPAHVKLPHKAAVKQ